MLEPLVADDHHGLREIKRGKGRIDRQRDDHVGERDLVVFKPDALAPEQDRDLLAARHALRDRDGRRIGADDGFCLIVAARGGGKTKLQSAIASASVS